MKKFIVALFVFGVCTIFTINAEAVIISSLDMNGINGSTVFNDSTGKTWTPFGNTQISTAQSKSGGASALFDGSGDYLQADNSADFNFGAGAFSFDFWMRALSLNGGANAYLAGRSHPDGGLGYDIRLDIDEVQVVGVNGWDFNIGTYNVPDNSYLTQDVWHHVILSSTDAIVYLVVDDLLRGTSPRSAISDGVNPFRIGFTTNFGGTGYNGYIDDFKVYDEAIWPPTTQNTAVPEPSTLVFFGTSLLGLAFRRKKPR